MDGICVEIIQAIEQIDPEIRFNGHQEFLPFKRLQLYLESGELDVFFGLKNSKERLHKYIFSDIPLYQLNYVVAVRADDEVSVSSMNDIRALGDQGSLLTVFGTAASRFLKNRADLRINDSAPTPVHMTRALLAGRGRFAFYHDLGLQNVIKSEALEQRIRILPISFSTYYHYAAFSKTTSSEKIDRVKAALQKLQDDGTLSRINSKYGLAN